MNRVHHSSRADIYIMPLARNSTMYDISLVCKVCTAVSRKGRHICWSWCSKTFLPPFRCIFLCDCSSEILIQTPLKIYFAKVPEHETRSHAILMLLLVTFAIISMKLYFCAIKLCTN